jgi:hypothetical protein
MEPNITLNKYLAYLRFYPALDNIHTHAHKNITSAHYNTILYM